MLLKPKKRRKLKYDIMKYAKDYCEYCAVSGKLLSGIETSFIIDPPHHILPKQMGGSSNPAIHHPDNLITLCRYCHDAAHHKIKGYYISPDELKRAKEGNNADDSI